VQKMLDGEPVINDTSFEELTGEQIAIAQFSNQIHEYGSTLKTFQETLGKVDQLVCKVEESQQRIEGFVNQANSAFSIATSYDVWLMGASFVVGLLIARFTKGR
jgi:hypothetical protein